MCLIHAAQTSSLQWHVKVIAIAFSLGFHSDKNQSEY
jgi:hypothetical protein